MYQCYLVYVGSSVAYFIETVGALPWASASFEYFFLLFFFLHFYSYCFEMRMFLFGGGEVFRR